MTEPNNKYYKQWLEYENKKKTESNLHISKAKLSRAIDKIKTEEKAKNIFELGNKINSSKHTNYKYYNKCNNYNNNNNNNCIITNNILITNSILITNPVIIKVQFS